MKPRCRCRGIDLRTPCEKSATEEDGLCDGCREHDCENCESAKEFQNFITKHEMWELLPPLPPR